MIPILNLSKSLVIKTPQIKHTIMKFSAGETHITIQDTKLIKTSDVVTIASSMKNSDDIMLTLMATDAIRRINNNIKINLVAPYFPYARQDRVMNPGEPLSAKVMANLINTQDYNKVTIFDPHSDVTCALINNVNIVNNHRFVDLVIEDLYAGPYTPDDIYQVFKNEIRIVSPDAGAQKKIYDVCKFLKYVDDDEGIILGSKVRNVRTGRITKTEYVGNVENKVCIIIDDIIDGGVTFIELGKKLKEGGASKVYLVVSHGIFSKGFDELFKYIDKVYTTDSIYLDESNDSRVRVLNLIDCKKELFYF